MGRPSHHQPLGGHKRVTGQRRENTPALNNELVFLPRVSVPCNILVLLVSRGPYFLLRVELLILYGNTAGLQVGDLNKSHVLTNPRSRDPVKSTCLLSCEEASVKWAILWPSSPDCRMHMFAEVAEGDVNYSITDFD